VAAVLRLWGLGYSFSNDELSALLRLQTTSFVTLIQQGVVPDFHPAGVQVFLWIWVRLGGMSEEWVRLPFVLSGLGAVGLTYVLGRRWFGTSSGLIASAAMAVLSFPVLYSQLARPYASGMLWILVLLWAWDRFLFDPGSRRAGALLGYGGILSVALAVCMYNHYFSFLLAGIIGLSGLFFVRGRKAIAYLLSGLVAVLLFLPHLKVSMLHFGEGGLGTWLGPPPLSWPWDHWVSVFNASPPLAAGMLVPLVLALVRRVPGARVQPRLLLMWWGLPLAVAYTYSLWVNPVAQHSILIFGLPLLLLALAAPFRALGEQTAAWAAVGILALGGTLTVLVTQDHKERQFADFREAADFIAARQDAIDEGKAVLALNSNSTWYLGFYHDRILGTPLLTDGVRDMEGLRTLRMRLDSCQAEEIVFVSVRPCPPETYAMLADRYPVLLGRLDQDGLAWGVHRSVSGSAGVEEPSQEILRSLVAGFEAQDTLMEGQLADTAWYTKGSGSLSMPAGHEFSPALSVAVEGNVRAWISADVLWTEGHGEPQLVAAVVSQAGETLYWRSSQVRIFVDAGSASRIHLFIAPDENIPPGAVLHAYVWNPGGASLSVDQLQIKLLKP